MARYSRSRGRVGRARARSGARAGYRSARSGYRAPVRRRSSRGRSTGRSNTVRVVIQQAPAAPLNAAQGAVSMTALRKARF